MHNVSRVSSVGGISSTNRCWGGASPRRQHLFSRRRRRRREGLPLFHLHSRLLSLPPFYPLYIHAPSFSKAPSSIEKSSQRLILFLPLRLIER